MKRNFKRILSSVLCLLMIVQVFGVGAIVTSASGAGSAFVYEQTFTESPLDTQTSSPIFTPETPFDLSVYDYVVDAIDTVSAKLALVERCTALGVPIICSMGTGNKLDPAQFEVADISKTSVCPLAKVMRVELRKRGISHLKVVYSREQPQGTVLDQNGRRAPGSVSFVPGAAGLLLASEVIKDLVKGMTV